MQTTLEQYARVPQNVHIMANPSKSSAGAPPVKVTAVPAFDDNYIWLLQRHGGRYAAIVDPGDAQPVLEALGRLRLTPAAILITHHHYDHTGGIENLLAHTPMLVYGPARESIPACSRRLKEGDRVELTELGMQLQVMDVPGHTGGHIAYLADGRLFCGDTLFTGGCGRLFEGTPEQMSASLDKLARLPDTTSVYCAHEYTLANLGFARVVEPGNQDLLRRIDATEQARAKGHATVPATLGTEKRTNPFLRTRVGSVVAAAEGFAGRPLAGAAEVFGVLRHWKDTLD
jgi:hydroxyacylglutathione hydrolase